MKNGVWIITQKNETCFNLRFFRDTSVKVEKIVITENETKILKSYCWMMWTIDYVVRKSKRFTKLRWS